MSPPPFHMFLWASIIQICVLTVADPGFGGRGGVNCHRQGRSPCSRHEVPSGGRVREGGVPPTHVEENGNQEMLRGLLKHTKAMLYINIDKTHL